MRPSSEALKEYGRGIAGGLLFSLPLLYTMEVWWTGFLVEPTYLIAYLGAMFLLLLGYNRFAGMREDASWIEVGMDSIEEMGIGLLLSALVLFLLGQITADMATSTIVGKIVVQSMTVAAGVSVGTAQLGQGGSDTGVNSSGVSEPKSGGQGEPGQDTPDTMAQLVLGFCGALLFAANVAPTAEIQMIGRDAGALRLLGLAGLSLLIGAVALFFSGFVGAESHVPSMGIFWSVFGILTSYATAMLAATLMLWFFHQVPVVVGISQVVVLAFPAMLGASAGRLLIQ